MVNLGNMARRLGFQGQYFYGFTNGNYDKPVLTEDLKSLAGDYHSLALDKLDALIFLYRVLNYYKQENSFYNIPEKNVRSAIEYILESE